MKCTEFKILIDDYSTNELGEELKASCDVHLSSCEDCSGLLAAQNKMLESLRAMPVAGPSEGFEQRALRAAVNQNSHPSHHRSFMVGFGSAVAAALALWVVVGISPTPVSDLGKDMELAKVENNVDQAENSIPEFSIALNEQSDIKLAFYSSAELKDAQITLLMPRDVTLAGFPGKRELAWKTNLAKGNNLLRLPVIATGSDGGLLVAQIEYMGKVRKLKLNLAVNKAGISGSTGSVLHLG